MIPCTLLSTTAPSGSRSIEAWVATTRIFFVMAPTMTAHGAGTAAGVDTLRSPSFCTILDDVPCDLHNPTFWTELCDQCVHMQAASALGARAHAVLGCLSHCTCGHLPKGHSCASSLQLPQSLAHKIWYQYPGTTSRLKRAHTQPVSVCARVIQECRAQRSMGTYPQGLPDQTGRFRRVRCPESRVLGCELLDNSLSR